MFLRPFAWMNFSVDNIAPGYEIFRDLVLCTPLHWLLPVSEEAANRSNIQLELAILKFLHGKKQYQSKSLSEDHDELKITAIS